MANTITTLITWFKGKQIGEDLLGNKYYQDKKNQTLHGRQRRWVVYKNHDQAANIPPLCHAWLHHTSNEFPTTEQQQINQNPNNYKPQSSLSLKSNSRPKASGDYQAWQP